MLVFIILHRAFGDAEFKKDLQSMMNEESETRDDGEERERQRSDEVMWAEFPLVLAEPEVEVTDISPEDQFIVLACDGLYDVFENKEVIEFIKSELESNGGNVQKCCEMLTYEAIKKRRSQDNVSVIIILLNKWF